MKIVSGVDLVYIPRFKKALENGRENFLRRIFLERELGQHLEHLAGIFAAKEAVMKALGLPVDSWHDIEIIYQSNGAPRLEIRNLKLEIRNYSLSISHDGNYVVAQFVGLIKKES